jgi:hypothetical protein
MAFISSLVKFNDFVQVENCHLIYMLRDDIAFVCLVWRSTSIQKSAYSKLSKKECAFQVQKSYRLPWAWIYLRVVANNSRFVVLNFASKLAGAFDLVVRLEGAK